MENELFSLKISVRNLVEFILRSGSIDNRRTAPMDADAMAEGSRIHRKIQGKMGVGYTAEVSLKLQLDYDDFTILIEGRADGIIEKDDEIVTIDEIKGVYLNLNKLEEPIGVHKAQAMCYAYIYALQNDLDSIGVQMTYCNIESEEIKRFREEYSFEEISSWFDELMEEYLKWARFMVRSRNERNESIKPLQFPYEYRNGQRDVAVSVYRTISRRKRLFIQAPTGIGKTMSTVFPTIKSMGEEMTEKIFYLTAKTITRTVAEEAFDILRRSNMVFRNVTLTAKEKICSNEECECNPDACTRANGHFDRINDAVFDVISNEYHITREVIEIYASKHNVCPFEMALDISNWVDGIICDYNYVFDPNVYLKRYFAQGSKGEYVFLIDEAHNLVERAREMNSASIKKEDFMVVRKILTPIKGEKSSIVKNLSKCNKIMLNYKRDCESYEVLDDVGEIVIPLMRIQTMLEKILDDNKDFSGRDETLDFYFQIRNFLAIHDRLDENYEIYCSFDEHGDFLLKLFCINPSVNLCECMDKGRTTIFFSATLLPVNYYKLLLTGDINDYAIYTSSPFDVENRLIVTASDVSSRYTRRNESEFKKIYEYIRTIVTAHSGNYMVFFPSYRLMEEVYKYLPMNDDGILYIMQSSNMNEESREQFLDNFANNRNVVAFCVLGGIFSEGIDLKHDNLIGSIIVGTGLPQICTEREILKRHFDEHEGENGFDYAYRYPGMNKVLQAAGRVIRTNDDVGVIALLDERFMENSSRTLFPQEWSDMQYTRLSQVNEILEAFWEGKQKNEDT